MENKQDKKEVTSQPKFNKKKLGMAVIFLFLFGSLLFLTSNFKNFMAYSKQFFSFQTNDMTESTFEETTLDELRSIRRSFKSIDKKITDLDEHFSQRLLKIEDQVNESNSQDNFRSIEIINSELLRIKDKLDQIYLKDDRGSALIFSIGQLEKRIMSSEPFEEELLVVKNLNDDENIRKIIERLEPLSKQAIPTIQDLQIMLSSIAKSVILSEKDLKNLNFFEKIKYKISSLIHIRKIGNDVSEKSTQGLIALAEVEIKAGNLLEAVDYLEKIQGAPKKLLINLIKNARSRIIADESIKDFSNYIISRIQ